ncbi:hypothetical protein PVL29_018978 [Vitis rotundifolia]|uniref:BHLH domain-containing protein n=1 Tax=Vitis rotundifolia TaxID=103349 RepID=A0AA38Z6L2_VITRO|nr:hypothetical protein PVL29_018978 [Vitis rotundifolia]
MDSNSWNSASSHGSDCFQVFDPFPHNTGGSRGVVRGGSLVLDSDRGELVKAPVITVKKEVPEAKAMAALKSHSDAERRRRERINAHLDTLRGFVPCTEKMDKAKLLAEVIRQVKELKRNATQASEGLLLPIEVDEVRVEPHDDRTDGAFSLRASVCCDYRPELLSYIKQALDTLPINTVKAEISTLGGRMKNVFVFTSCKQGNSNNAKAHMLLASSVHQTLSSILDKVSTSPEFSPRTTHPKKRQRVSIFDSSSSSSSEQRSW